VDDVGRRRERGEATTEVLSWVRISRTTPRARRPRALRPRAMKADRARTWAGILEAFVLLEEEPNALGAAPLPLPWPKVTVLYSNGDMFVVVVMSEIM
jgi:hypothetical protein